MSTGTRSVQTWRAPVMSAALALCSFAVHAQEVQRQLTQGQDVVGGAGIIRVLIGFVVVAGLAVGAIFVLKRAMPKLGGPLAAGGDLRVLERASVSPGLRIHVVQYRDEKILLAESRNALAMIALRKGEGAAP
jgi:flagellar biogenesis protein FliO